MIAPARTSAGIRSYGTDIEITLGPAYSWPVA